MDYNNNYKVQRAKRLLKHYISLLAENTGVRIDSDCRAEIDEIVDNIVEAAVEIAVKEIKGGGKNEA